MFTSAFANNIIAPTAQGQPGFVAALVHFGMRIILLHPAVSDTLIALIQLLIGGLIIHKRSARIGLIVSVIWSILVWIFGEGFAGIFSGHALLLMGAPGAAIIYGILALALLPARAKAKSFNMKRSTPVAAWLIFIWAGLWIGGAVLQLLPGQNSASSVGQMISINARHSPSWIRQTDANLARTINGLSHGSSKTTMVSEMGMTIASSSGASNSGYLLIWLLSAVQLAIGLLVFANRFWRRSALVAGIILSLAFWVFGQNFGGIFSGLATDLNSGPLFILLALAILGTKNMSQYLSRIGQRIERLLVGATTSLKEPLV